MSLSLVSSFDSVWSADDCVPECELLKDDRVINSTLRGTFFPLVLTVSHLKGAHAVFAASCWLLFSSVELVCMLHGDDCIVEIMVGRIRLGLEEGLTGSPLSGAGLEVLFISRVS